MATPLVIVGAGGHGRETLDIVDALNDASTAAGEERRFEVVGFIADDADSGLLSARGQRLLGPLEALAELLAEHGAAYTLAIGMPWARAPVGRRLADDGIAPVAEPLVHPAATLGGANTLAPGVLIAAGARVTTNVSLGVHTHLNVGAVVSHDCVVGDYVTLSPGALVNGSCELDDEVFLGTGAIVIPGVRIGARARVAAGAVVTADVPPDVTAIGVPARWVPAQAPPSGGG